MFWRDFFSNLPFPDFTETAFVSWGSRRGRGFHLEREQRGKKNGENKKRDRKQRDWFKKNNKQLSWLSNYVFFFFF